MNEASVRPRLLVIDNEASTAPVVDQFARALGFDVTVTASARMALAQLPQIRPDVALVDPQLPELSGVDVLRAIRKSDTECQVIMAGSPSAAAAMEAVKAGALDYLHKPYDFERLESLLTGVSESLTRRGQLLQADADVASRMEFHGMVGRSVVMQRLFEAIRRLAPHARNLLVTGETGTGKELVARALHQEGRRRLRRFHTVSCSAVVEQLLETELFGQAAGVVDGSSGPIEGVFEHVSGGTLFLDDVSDVPMGTQPKLLRAVEHGEIQRVGAVDMRRTDVCIIAATSRDLRQDVARGRFRPDLFHRLAGVDIHVPPLRERREDIPYLTADFLGALASRAGRPLPGVSTGAERLLQQAPWPGNVRELRNVIERAFVASDGRMLTQRDVTAAMTSHGVAATRLERPVPAAPLEPESLLLSAAQRDQIRRVLHEARGNKSSAARMLGVSRRSLYRWLDRLNIEH